MSDQPNASASSDKPAGKPPTWRGARGVPVTVAPPGLDTPNGPVITIHFDALRIALRRSDEPAAVRCTGVVATPEVEAPGQRVRIRHDLRGGLIKQADARVSITADCGGSIQALEYPYGAETNEPIERTFENTVELRPGQPYLITLTISAERRTADADLDVTLDSIDLEITPEPPPANGEPKTEGEAAAV